MPSSSTKNGKVCIGNWTIVLNFRKKKMRNAIQDNPEKKNFNLCSASFFNLSVIKSLACKTPLLTTLVLLGCLSYSYTYYVIYIYKKKKKKKKKKKG